MTETKPYIIDPNAWELIYCGGTEEYMYVDYDLEMVVYLEETKPDAYTRLWGRYDHETAWYLKAESRTHADSANSFYFDALEPDFKCGCRLKPAPKEQFFTDDDELKPIELPAWLIKHMQWLADDDVQATCDFDTWSKECNGETFADYDAMRDSLIEWYKREYPNKYVDPFFIDLILTVGDADYCIHYNSADKTYSVSTY